MGGQMQGSKQHFGPRLGQVWPSWALLRYLEATALLLAAKLGDLEGKLRYREVMLKLTWLCYVMLKLYVRFCSAMLLVLHPEMLSPQHNLTF